MTNRSLFEGEPEPVKPAKIDREALRQEHRRAQLARLGAPEDWQLAPPPELNGEKRIVLNAETEGLRWFDGHKPVGWSYLLPESGRKGYLPMRHRVGENLGVEQVREWLGGLKNVHIENINTKFDLHMSRADGVDLVEDTGNIFSDVAHEAALLDDSRQRFNLDQLCADVLGWDVNLTALGKQPSEIENESEFKYLHAGRVAPYAVRNVEQVERLAAAFAPQLQEQNLIEVMNLERDVLPVVVEMEKNGTYLDMDLLSRWRDEVKQKIADNLWSIYKGTGIEMTSADSSKQLAQLFKARGIPITSFTKDEHGRDKNPSFTGAVLKATGDPMVLKAYETGQLADLDSKYLSKYFDTVRSDGWLRFQLHQLRAVKDKDSDDVKGTCSGRFSAAGDREGGYNPQQVVAVEKQLERGWCPDYVVRKLFIPGPGEIALVASDMMQVEYRLFAHYADDPAINAAYAADPMADYHKVVMNLLHQINASLNRKLVKNINFAKIYGAGLIKFALMLGQITLAQFESFNERLRKKDWSVLKEPALAPAAQLNEAYNRMFPAVKPLLDKASEVARQRGYVKTLAGRRARLSGRFHSALNRIVQGGAADWNKRVAVEVYRRRKELGIIMRLTVHDELVNGTLPGFSALALDSVLNAQYYPVRVPILWDTHIGRNWAECK